MYKASISNVHGRSALVPVAGSNRVAYVAGSIVVVVDLEELYDDLKLSYFCLPSALDADVAYLTIKDETQDSPNARSRLRKISAIALSQDDNFLAVGEQGSNPRVVLWDLRCIDREPIGTLDIHTYGVRLLSFCPRSRYLATVGFTHDGNIHIWELRTSQGARRVASNKVTSNLTCMLWIGRKVVTIGTRHVKVWSFQDSGPPSQGSTDVVAMLEGRNVILGSLVHETFIGITSYNHDQCIIMTSTSVATFNVNDPASLHIMSQQADPMSSMVYSHEIETLTIGFANGNILNYAVSSNEGRLSLRNCEIGQFYLSLTQALPSGTAIQAIQNTTNHDLVATSLGGYYYVSKSDRECSIQVLAARSLSTRFSTGSVGKCSDLWPALRTIQAGRSPVMEVFDEFPELTCIAQIKDTLVLYGTMTGRLVLYDVSERCARDSVHAHDGEVTHIALSENQQAVATVGKDKMVQIFLLQHDSESNLTLLQTVDDHSSMITSVIWVCCQSALLILSLETSCSQAPSIELL